MLFAAIAAMAAADAFSNPSTYEGIAMAAVRAPTTGPASISNKVGEKVLHVIYDNQRREAQGNLS
jgi:hypothetical protein